VSLGRAMEAAMEVDDGCGVRTSTTSNSLVEAVTGKTYSMLATWAVP
jgi:hypothetical protein